MTLRNMVPAIRDEWVDNLTNGKYKQAQQVLNNVTDGSFCCLGVLCDMAVKAGVIGEPSVRDMWLSSLNADVQVSTYADAEGDHWTSVLPPEVIAWSGIGSDTGHFVDEKTGRSSTLANLNDDGATFVDIATVIKENS